MKTEKGETMTTARERLERPARTYLGGYEQALCLCPLDRCSSCVRADVNDTKPVMAIQCAYNCPVAQSLTRMGYTGSPMPDTTPKSRPAFEFVD